MRVIFALGLLSLVATLANAAECDVPAPPEEGVSFARPVAGSVLRAFGNQYDEVAKTKNDHTGVDFEAAEGEPVHAAGGGKVVEAGEKGELGNYVRLDTGYGLFTGYGHLASIAVGAGECVKPGQVIGNAGASGIALRTQVHFEVWDDGKPVDPLRYLQ